ncbi:pre-mRNA-splicing factor ATP-dependent RNA helicase PRP43 [Mycena latifolia]|nr:pre-mRNA-splicing factor ATP-dependent RNA helicase PRP43 [Mycena latifolia]
MSSPTPLEQSAPESPASQGNEVRKELDKDVNSFTGKPHSEQYRTILNARKKLPVYEQMDEFYHIFSKNQIMIVVGATGSGKTTQIPQFVAYSDLPHTKGKRVACTQPRRMTAKGAAKRVADEMDVKLGAHVGYSIRFEDMTEPGTTFLAYLTDGTLLREAIGDPNLNRYSTIILDEVHERTLATDILMALLKSLVKKRSDLNIILMSAAADALKLQRYMRTDSAGVPPIFEVSGKMFPVEVFFTQEPEPDYVEAAIRTVLKIHCSEDPGDILLFLTGEEEIEKTCRRLKSEAAPMTDEDPFTVGPLVCIPLYSSLPPERQQHIYNPPPSPQTLGGAVGRKVIVATNIAETALTIDGIVYVVDPGFSKLGVYNPRIRIESQLVSPISKAAAQQRAGRAGRTRPGKCFRLYTELDFLRELDEQNTPEILRSNLSSMVIQLVKFGIKDLVRFDYLDAPAPESLMRALELLNYLDALDDEGNITTVGTLMPEFPLEPQLGKILIVSPQFKCSEEILTIAAILSVPHIWRRPNDQRSEADAAKARLSIPGSDHLTLLNAYNQYKSNIDDKSWAQSHYLSGHALSQADKARKQLERIMKRFKVELISLSDQELHARIKQVLVCGFFMQAAHKVAGKNEYLTIKDNQLVMLHPSCGFARAVKKPEWVIFNELVLTARPYIRTVTEVRPEWLLKYAPIYFDLETFRDGETKRALRRVARRTHEAQVTFDETLERLLSIRL